MSTLETTVADLLTSYQRHVRALGTVAESIEDLPPIAVAAAMIRAAITFAAENDVCPACLAEMLTNARAVLPTAHRDDGPGLDEFVDDSLGDDDEIGPTVGEA